MKFTIEKKPLAAALSQLARVVERRNTYPILANVWMSATTDGRLELRATDLDIEITRALEARVFEPGITTMPAHMLSDMIRKAPDGAEVTVELAKDEIAAIKYGRSRFQLATLSPDSFPDLKTGNWVAEFSMPAADLSRIFTKTAFAISTEETRYYLNGVYVHACTTDDGELVLRGVATDGHRMARSECLCPIGADGMPGVIVPRKTVAELQKLIDGVDGEINLQVSDSKFRVSFGEIVLTSKLIEGTFPDYQRVTPKLSNTIAEIDVAHLRTAIDRVSTISTERGGKAIKFRFKEGILELEVVNADHGTSSEDMPAAWGGDPFEIGFNARYALDILSALPGEKASISLTDAGSPTRFSSPDDPASLYVLMPMRV